MKKSSQYYYKVVSKISKNGITIDTTTKIDFNIIMRLSELNNLFDLIYNCSEHHNIPIKQVLTKAKSQKTLLFTRNTLKKDLNKIKKEVKSQNFILNSEFRYFTYYVSAKTRKDLTQKPNSISLPNRFESSFFFGSIKDCQIYLKKINDSNYKNTPYNFKIIKVLFEEIKSLHKFDNILLTTGFKDDFHSKDFYRRLKDFLLSKETENPLFEYVFQGSYRIIKNDIEI